MSCYQPPHDEGEDVEGGFHAGRLPALCFGHVIGDQCLPGALHRVGGELDEQYSNDQEGEVGRERDQEQACDDEECAQCKVGQAPPPA